MHERLLAYIQRRVASPQDAEDILQGVFVRIHAKLGSLKDNDSVTAWVFRIAHNAIADYHRKQATEVRVLLKHSEDLHEGSPSNDPDIVSQANAEFAHCIEPLMGGLSKEYREALVLTELNGMSQADAAATLGLSVSGMKSRVQRGRRKLKDVVLDCCDVEFDRRGELLDYTRKDGSECGGNCQCG